jgi:hypothetical protein
VLTLGLWCGAGLFFSYAAAPQVFATLRDRLPSQPIPGVSGITPETGVRLAGQVVGAIFPIYFVAQGAVAVLALASAGLLMRQGAAGARIRVALIAGALFVLAVQGVAVYPRSVRVLESVHQAQDSGDSAGAAQLRRSFGALHGVSQLLNLTTLCLATAALGFAGAGLSPASHRE